MWGRFRTRITAMAGVHQNAVESAYITYPPPHLCRRSTDSLPENKPTSSTTTTTTTAPKTANCNTYTVERMMGPESYESASTSSSRGLNIGPGTVIASKYELLRKVGEGGFGTVFAAVDSRGRRYAVKIEESKSETLRNEKDIYSKISEDKHGYQAIGIPRMFYFGEASGYDVMVLEMLGPSLHKLRGRTRFSLKTCFMIALQLLSRLEHLHQRGFVHRDLKPDNILIGKPRHERTLHLLDYGLTKTFRDRRGRHIESRSGSFVGTAQYSSRHVMRQVRATRRDDLESLGYLLAEMRRGDLPWSRIPRRNGDRARLVLECKSETSDEELAEGFPGLEMYLGYVRNLRFADRPSYRYLRECFERKMRDLAIVDDGNFDWVIRR